jgi:hypothetical protein
MTNPPPPEVDMSVLHPINANRDLYIGIWIDGCRYVMTLQEDDPKLVEKVRELFWIMITNLLSSRKSSRIFVWLLYTLSFALLGAALLRNVAEPIQSLF